MNTHLYNTLIIHPISHIYTQQSIEDSQASSKSAQLIYFNPLILIVFKFISCINLPQSDKQSNDIFPPISMVIIVEMRRIYQLIMEKIIMEDCSRTRWSNKQLRIISKQRERIREIEQQSISQRIIEKDMNHLDFYKITPKQELPKFLQKMRFQTLHLKEKDITNSIKVFKKENKRPEEKQQRKKLRAQGHIMLLSEIYQYLGENGDNPKRLTTHSKATTQMVTSDLDEWEKLRKQQRFQLTSLLPKVGTDQKLIQNGEVRTSELIPKQFKEGSDYKGEIQRSLGIIQVTHASEFNLMNRYLLVQNSSKLLKKELDEKKMQIQESIKSKMKQLYQSRTEYHNLFQEKNRLKLQQRLLNEDVNKEDSFHISHKSLSNIRTDKTNELRNQKRGLLQQNENKIQKTKLNIASLEEAIAQQQQQLRKMMMAQKLYYKVSLKNGNDVRQSGLVWIIKKLQIKEQDMGSYQYPQFLDRKCRLFLVQKAASEDEEELLLQEKRKFVNQIGKNNSEGKLKYKNIVSPKQFLADRIVQGQLNSQSVPKKYRRSLKKITLLNQQYIKNSSLLELRQRERNKLFEISADLQGMTNKQIYSQIGERIKHLDLSKMKKDKIGSKKLKLIEYQNLLQKIKSIHIKLQEMDLQMQNYLLTHYKDNRNLYFMQAAACFGYKRAYSMIIKHFSWKTYHEASNK